jgi:predicted nucleotidyltransferase component of viral defense system
MAEILTKKQLEILAKIGGNENICRDFYLTGGTALAEFYLQHRLSEDLDFFSEKEVEPQAIAVFWKQYQKALGIKKVAFEQSFNRNLFFLHLEKEIIKTEFTYFPFPRIEKKIKIGKLFVDSLLDIAVNKVFTIYQNPRSRDFIDLYLIIEKTGWKIDDLVKKARMKFEWHIDPLRLGAQFIKAKEVKDYPRMITKIKPEIWQDFFLNEAEKFKDKILKN